MPNLNAILFILLGALSFTTTTALNLRQSATETNVTADELLQQGFVVDPYILVNWKDFDEVDKRGLNEDLGPYAVDSDFAKSHNLKCNAKFDHPYQDTHEDKVMWSATHFCSLKALNRDNITAPIYVRTLSKHPWQWDMPKTGTNLDEPGPFLEDIGEAHLIGHHNVFEMSVVGIKDDEDKKCAKNGGQEDRYNNLWRQPDDMLCEDFFYSTWKLCNNEGRGGSIDVACMRYKMDTVW